MTAFPDCTALTFRLGLGGIFALPTTLADLSKLVKPMPDVLDLNFVEPPAACCRDTEEYEAV